MQLPKYRLVALTLFALAVTTLIGCQGAKPAPPVPPPPAVTVARPVMYSVQAYNEYNGHLETTQSVEIRARVKGILAKVHFKEGTEVEGPVIGPEGKIQKPGAPLYNIDDREYKTAVKKAEADLEKAKADIENWKAQIDLAKAELKRAEGAALLSAAAQTDVDKAKATLNVDVAQLAAAVAQRDASAAALQTANIQLGYTDIRAPIGGRINRTMVDEGNLVGQNEATMLTTIVRMDELYVYFDVPERDLVEFQQTLQDRNLPDPTSQQVPVEVAVSGEVGYPHVGRLDFRENRVETATGTVRVRGRVPNPQVGPNKTRLLYPGLYARVRVPFGEPQARAVIPEAALLTGQEGRFVYVVTPDNKVAKRTVTLGPHVYRGGPAEGAKAPPWVLAKPNSQTQTPVQSVVAIETGLSPDDVIIVNGLQRARPGGEVAPEAWEFRGPPAPK
jgi:RND family efflux transporter MFP subunit